MSDKSMIPASAPIASPGQGVKVDIPEFENAFGEPFRQTLDMNTWTLGEDLLETYGRIEQEVAEALDREKGYRQIIREEVFSRIRETPGAPKNAGCYQAKRSDLERIHRGLLFNGGVEACDGISVVHDTIPLTITQIGVCLVSYNGNQGTWAHRLFRRDLRSRLQDPVEEVLTVLQRRERREAQGVGEETISELARRGIMTYAERALLKDKSQAPWRMGHGSPIPFELITGLWASQRDRIRQSLDMIEWYVGFKRFVFVPSAPAKRHLLMMGDALNPLEFAVVDTLQPEVRRRIDSGGYRSASAVLQEMERFCEEVAPNIVVGIYRAWEASPPHLFYAHVDCAEMAAHIVMADSILQEHRGFPMLIDLADTVCSTSFGVDSLIPTVQTAYARSGEPFRYLGERETRS